MILRTELIARLVDQAQDLQLNYAEMAVAAALIQQLSEGTVTAHILDSRTANFYEEDDDAPPA